MYHYTETESSLQSLYQIHRELRELLLSCAIGEPVMPRHSLFSSRRIFRADEMHLGLNQFGTRRVFSAN